MFSFALRPNRTSGFGILAAFLASVFVTALPAVSRADIDENLVVKARNFLETKEVGELVCSSLHFGYKYQGRLIDKDTMVRNVTRDGAVVNGEFALVYTFKWDDDDDGRTDVAFFFDRFGKLNDIRTLDTNAGILNQPWTLANAAITIVGDLLIEACKDHMTAAQLSQARHLIDNADARQLMILNLQIRQALE